MTRSEPAIPSPGLPAQPGTSIAVGLANGVLAYTWWGFATTLYFRWVGGVDPLEQLASRVVFGLPVMLLIIAWRRRFAEVLGLLTSRRALPVLVASSGLIAVNWFTFVYAVTAERLKEASLGYYVNPLLSVLLGVVFLHERLRGTQLVSVAIAGTGVAFLTAHVLGSADTEPPWVAGVLAVSFGLYGLLRKASVADAFTGLTIELTILLVPMLAIFAWLGLREHSVIAAAVGISPLSPQTAAAIDAEGTGTAAVWTMALRLTLAGAVTIAALIWFAAAARRLRLSTIGLLQYIAPTGQLLLAVKFGAEEFTPAWAVTFRLIWLALLVFSIDAALPRLRRPPRRLVSRRPRARGVPPPVIE